MNKNNLPKDVLELLGTKEQNPNFKSYNGKYYVLSKEDSNMYIFDKNHNLINQTPSLRGKTKGDFVNKADVNSPLPGEYATTRGGAGSFSVINRFEAGKYGTPFYKIKYNDKEGDSENLGVHGIYKPEFASRKAILDNPNIKQKCGSWGCINVDSKWLLQNSPAIGDSIFITKEPQDIKKMSNTTVTTSTKTKTSQPPKTSAVQQASSNKTGTVKKETQEKKQWINQDFKFLPNTEKISERYTSIGKYNPNSIITPPIKWEVGNPVQGQTKKSTPKSYYNNKGKSTEEVKTLQQRLGVDADGKWGEKTQAAYESMVEKLKLQSLQDNIENRKIVSRPAFIPNNSKVELAKKFKEGGKNWIQKAVNPKHKGYCTPMTKPTCTPRRKAFAMTMKKHHGFHKEEGGTLTATKDSTQYFSDKLKENIANHFKAKTKSEKEDAAKKATQSKNSLIRQGNKGKPGFDKNGFPVKKQNGGEMPKGGDQAAVYKKGDKVKQMGGQIYGTAKNGTKIDASKWKKSK